MSDCIESRQLSSALVNGTLHIDPGTQVLDALRVCGVDPVEVRYVINTHVTETTTMRQPFRFCKTPAR